MKKNCAVYLRVSTKKQDYERQMEDIRELAKSNGHTLEDAYIFTDKESGTKKKEERDGISTLLNLIEKGEIGFVYFWEITRLSRSLLEVLQVCEFLEDHKIQAYFHLQKLYLLDDTKRITPFVKIILSTLGFMAENELEQLKGRITSGKRQYVRQGKYNGGKIKFGYTISQFGKVDDSSKKKFILNTKMIEGLGVSEVDIVREVFDLYESGLTCKKIALRCQAKGYPKITNSPHTVARMLRDTSYIGYKDVKLGRRPVPRIIEDAQFKRVGEMVDENKTKADKGRNHTYLLRGILKCRVCGNHYHGKQTDDAYQCSQNNQTNKITHGTSCKGSNISISNIDGVVWERVKHIWINKSLKYFEDLYKADETEVLGLEKSIKLYQNLMPKFDAKRKKINTKYDNDGITDDEYSQQMKELKNERSKVENEIAKLESKIRRIERTVKKSDTVIGRQKDIESIEDRNEQKELIAAFVREVTFYKISMYKTLVYITYHSGQTEHIIFNSVAKKEIAFKLINSKAGIFNKRTNDFLLFKEKYHKEFQASSLQEFAKAKLENPQFEPISSDNSDNYTFDELMTMKDIPNVITKHTYKKMTYFKDINKKRFNRKRNPS